MSEGFSTLLLWALGSARARQRHLSVVLQLCSRSVLWKIELVHMNACLGLADLVDVSADGIDSHVCLTLPLAVGAFLPGFMMSKEISQKSRFRGHLAMHRIFSHHLHREANEDGHARPPFHVVQRHDCSLLDASRLGQAESGRAFKLVMLVLDCCLHSRHHHHHHQRKNVNKGQSNPPATTCASTARLAAHSIGSCQSSSASAFCLCRWPFAAARCRWHVAAAETLACPGAPAV